MKWHAELVRLLQQRGIGIVTMEHRRKCMALTLKRNSVVVKYYTGLTPSDRRALDNAVGDIDRLLRTKETT